MTKSLLPGVAQDVRYAARLLRRQPGYAAVAILAMALGIGATTTLFSVAYGVLFKPLPWPDASRIMRVTETRGGQPARLQGTISNGAFLAWRAQSATIDAIGGYGVVNSSMTATRSTGGEPIRLQVARATPSLFDVLKSRPLRGRLFSDDEAPMDGRGVPPNPTVVIISYGLWQDWFARRDDAIGSVMRLDDIPVTVIGVMERDFTFPEAETRA
jgi:putative ABC transport system permease protein